MKILNPIPRPSLKRAIKRMCACVHAKLLQSCPTPWDPMDRSPLGSSGHGILQQEYWSGLPCPPPGDRSDAGMELASLLHWQAGSLPLLSPGKPIEWITNYKEKFTASLLFKVHKYEDQILDQILPKSKSIWKASLHTTLTQAWEQSALNDRDFYTRSKKPIEATVSGRNLLHR